MITIVLVIVYSIDFVLMMIMACVIFYHIFVAVVVAVIVDCTSLCEKGDAKMIRIGRKEECLCNYNGLWFLFQFC